MAVCSDGSLFGSIGGGVMEYRLAEECKKLLANNEQKIFIKKQVHKGSVTDGSGMICSGEQTIAFAAFNTSHSKLLEDIISVLANNNLGELTLSPKGVTFNLSDSNVDAQYDCNIVDNNNWTYKEIIGFKNTLYIIGAGHVGYAVSKLFSQINFRVVIIDNRPDLDMMTENTFADEKLLVDYANIDDYIAEGKSTYVVIMTNNHTHDGDVLSKVLRKNVKYLGLMGSKQKVASLMKSMLKLGFLSNELDKVFAPIGVSINSKTPDEIAISIAAEIIGVKNSD